MATNSQGRYVSLLTRDTLALVLAGGRGSRLKHLTNWRAKPAVYFGGKFRIIDFPLSNCVNSGIRRIGVVTQYKAHSLIHHVQRSWGFLPSELGEFCEILPAQQRMTEDAWYSGTADAILQNLDIIRMHSPKYVLILAGDHVYKMDYGAMLAEHVDKQADVTVGCIPVPIEEASALGVMAVDEQKKITEFAEKPAKPVAMPDDSTKSLASMGIYIFNTEVLFDELNADSDSSTSSHDFGKDLIPKLVREKNVFAYPFVDRKTGEDAYWRDVGTIDSFWKANMELIGISPELNLYDNEWPLWTHLRQVPPAKFIFDDDGRRGMAVDSMVAGGCIVSGSSLRRSLLFRNVNVHSYCTIEDSVIFPEVEIGRNSVIRKAIIEKRCEIPPNTQIGVDVAEDRKRFHVSEGGVTLVTPEMLGQRIHYVR